MKPKIAIFDSGVGGLTVFREIHQRFPNDSIIYVGDTARVPYGCRSQETIRRYAEEILNHLLDIPLSAIVVACHTVSSVAIPNLQNILKSRNLKIPLLDVLTHSISQAIINPKIGKIGVIGTEATIQSGKYSDELLRLQPNIKIQGISCPLFVPLVEEGMVDGPITELVVSKYLSPLKGSVRSVILGCTHYPLLESCIQSFLGPSVTLIDPAKAVADALLRVLKPSSEGKGDVIFQVTDHPERFHRIAKMWLGETAPFPEFIGVQTPMLYSEDGSLTAKPNRKGFTSS